MFLGKLPKEIQSPIKISDCCCRKNPSSRLSPAKHLSNKTHLKSIDSSLPILWHILCLGGGKAEVRAVKGKNTKVLVVDDNLLLASLLQMMLEDEDYEARFAGDGIEGYTRYLLFRPELVITDLHIPGAGGVEMIRNIRKQDPWVRVIYMSGDLLSFLSVLNEEKRKYPVLILPKPLSREDLLNRLAELGNGENHGSSLHAQNREG